MRTTSFVALGAISLFGVAQPVVAHATDAVAATNGLQSNSSAFSKSAPVPFAAPVSSEAALPQAAVPQEDDARPVAEVPYEGDSETIYIRPTFQNSASQVRAQMAPAAPTQSSQPNATAYAPPSGSAWRT